MRSPGCHEHVGVLGFQFECRLAIEQVYTYCAIFGFDMFRPLDRTQIPVCCTLYFQDCIEFDGLGIGVPDTPKS
ncbi:unnamed protein product [Prunus armeniaca]